MTAVATQTTSFPNGLPRNGWPNGTGNNLNMTPEEVSRIFVPRKSVQRSNSSSSLSSTSSNSSTSTISPQPNQPNGVSNGDTGIRKKPGRGLWPSSKAEPVSGLSTARPSVSAAPSGASAASAISALHAPSQPSQQHGMNSQSQQNGTMRAHSHPDTPAVLYLLPMNGTFERKTITVPYAPDILKIGRQTNAKTLPTPNNGYFDSKVLSRQHAEVWADQEGKIWIRDVRSSNGTFVNGKRLSMENRDSEPHPLKEQDVLELGIDIVSEDGKSIVHSKVAARVEHAGVIGNNALEMSAVGEFSNVNSIGQHISPALRNRQASQGSISSGRFSNITSGNVAAYHAKWLQPVTMEQIAKRLNVELRQARLQSQDLNHTSDFVNAVISHQHPLPVPEPQKIHSPSKASETKARFSDPPGPPPSQPLPEKPDAAIRSKLAELPAIQPILRRSETEKGLLAKGDSPTKLDQATQINSLVEALSTAQREISSQGEKLRAMEEKLESEREARTSAEQRAERLSNPPATNGASEPIGDQSWELNTIPTGDPPEAATRLHEKCNLMKTEMESMRAQMEKFRLRAESAERESERDRQSLTDMVASIRRRDEAAHKRKATKDKKRKIKSPEDGKRSHVVVEEEIEGHTDLLAKCNDELNGHVQAVLARQETLKPTDYSLEPVAKSPVLSDQLTDLSATQLEELGKTVASLRSALESQGRAAREVTIHSRVQERIVQSAPYASILGVVILGMGMMAYLNGWQKVVER